MIVVIDSLSASVKYFCNATILWVKLWISASRWNFFTPDISCRIFLSHAAYLWIIYLLSWYDLQYFNIFKNQLMFRVGMVSSTKSLMDIFCRDLKSLFHQVLQIPSILLKVELAPQFQNQEMQFMRLTKMNTILYFLTQWLWISVCIWSLLSSLSSTAGTVTSCNLWALLFIYRDSQWLMWRSVGLVLSNISSYIACFRMFVFSPFLIKSLSFLVVLFLFVENLLGIEYPDHPFTGGRPRFGLIPAGSTDAIVMW